MIHYLNNVQLPFKNHPDRRIYIHAETILKNSTREKKEGNTFTSVQIGQIKFGNFKI